MMNLNFPIYSFDELSEKAKEHAIQEHRETILSEMSVSDFEGCGDPELDTPESMYEDEYNYILFEDEGVIDSIRANEYWFFQSGKPAYSFSYYAKIYGAKLENVQPEP